MEGTITILGSTGSIGTQTLQVISAFPERFSVGYLTTNRSIELLEAQTRQHNPKGVVIADEQAYRQFKKTTSFTGEILSGEEGLCQAAADSDNAMLMSALVGFSGVVPTFAAVQKGIPIALANKETLVSAGSVIMAAAKEHNTPVIAVDSEHSALLQCFVGEQHSAIEKIILTASGGPFRSYSAEALRSVTVQQALRHPNWTMGSKITIDSATLMNKGFEVIEAKWLFDIAATAIDVVIHPQSIIHSLVQFIDGSVKAQMGLPDMKVPIIYALSYPDRLPTNFPRMDLASIAQLTFEKPDTERFPCLRLAFEALEQGSIATTALNAANEIAVAAFLEEKIAFLDIPKLIEQAVQRVQYQPTPSLHDIIECDSETRRWAKTAIEHL